MNYQVVPSLKFKEHYDAWGPSSSQQVSDLKTAEEYCRKLACSHYENFPVVTWLLPRELHQHFYNVYAFCRWSDDLGDEIEVSAESPHPLAWWKTQTENMLLAKPIHPVLLALRRTVEEYQIPLSHFLDLINSFEQDQIKKNYISFDELLDYCNRSANPVGRIILHMAKVIDSESVQLADSICTGLQLANFWQDVRRDYEIGRIYLPQEDLLRFDVDLEQLKTIGHNTTFAELMKFEVDRAEQFLLKGGPLLNRVPRWLKYDLKLFQRGGLEILKKIRIHGYRVFESRPKLSKADFLKISLWSLWS